MPLSFTISTSSSSSTPGHSTQLNSQTRIPRRGGVRLRQTGRQTGRQTYRQAGRQAGRDGLWWLPLLLFVSCLVLTQAAVDLSCASQKSSHQPQDTTIIMIVKCVSSCNAEPLLSCIFLQSHDIGTTAYVLLSTYITTNQLINQ